MQMGCRTCNDATKQGSRRGAQQLWQGPAPPAAGLLCSVRLPMPGHACSGEVRDPRGLTDGELDCDAQHDRGQS